jgi:hypothetical protein
LLLKRNNGRVREISPTLEAFGRVGAEHLRRSCIMFAAQVSPAIRYRAHPCAIAGKAVTCWLKAASDGKMELSGGPCSPSTTDRPWAINFHPGNDDIRGRGNGLNSSRFLHQHQHPLVSKIGEA